MDTMQETDTGATSYPAAEGSRPTTRKRSVDDSAAAPSTLASRSSSSYSPEPASKRLKTERSQVGSSAAVVDSPSQGATRLKDPLGHSHNSAAPLEGVSSDTRGTERREDEFLDSASAHPSLETQKAASQASSPGTKQQSASGTNSLNGKARKGSKPNDSLSSQDGLEIKLGGRSWKLPQDVTILDSVHPRETWGDRLYRFCSALYRDNDFPQAHITASSLGSLLSSFLKNVAWHRKPGKKVKIKEVRNARKELKKSGAMAALCQRAADDAGITGPPAQPAGSGGEGCGDTGGGWEVDEEDGDDHGEKETEEDSWDTSQTQNSATASVLGADNDRTAPSARDWASLLETEPAPAPGTVNTMDGASDQDSRLADSRKGRSRCVVSEDEAAAEQQRYYPKALGPQGVCTICASSVHSALQCPSTICQHCRTDHFSWQCPQRMRCTKCRQLGHERSECAEKLAMTPEDGMECAFCGSQGHLEDDCDQVWRSYDPRQGSVKKVRYISAFCSLCGGGGHFSSDCGLRGELSWSPTWSLQNRDLYVDPGSTEEPMTAQVASHGTADPGLKMPGAASKRTHIFYADSDGSEEGEFLSEKVQPRGRPGQIRMASNIQFAPSHTPGAPTHAQPPLPPGPPPPGPPQPRYGSYSSLARSYGGQGNQLPPRPATRGGMPSAGPPPHSHASNGPAPLRNGKESKNRRQDNIMATSQGNSSQHKRKNKRSGK